MADDTAAAQTRENGRLRAELQRKEEELRERDQRIARLGEANERLHGDIKRLQDQHRDLSTSVRNAIAPLKGA